MSSIIIAALVGFGAGLALVLTYWAVFSKYRAILLDMKAALEQRPTAATVQTLIDAKLADATQQHQGERLGLMTATEAAHAADAAHSAAVASSAEKADRDDKLDHVVKMVASLESTVGTLTARVSELTARTGGLDKDIDRCFESLNTVIGRQESQAKLATTMSTSITGNAASFNKRLSRVESRLGQQKQSKDGADALAHVRKVSQEVTELTRRLEAVTGRYDRNFQQFGQALDAIHGLVRTRINPAPPAPAARADAVTDLQPANS